MKNANPIFNQCLYLDSEDFYMNSCLKTFHLKGRFLIKGMVKNMVSKGWLLNMGLEVLNESEVIQLPEFYEIDEDEYPEDERRSFAEFSKVKTEIINEHDPYMTLAALWLCANRSAGHMVMFTIPFVWKDLLNKKINSKQKKQLENAFLSLVNLYPDSKLSVSRGLYYVSGIQHIKPKIIRSRSKRKRNDQEKSDYFTVIYFDDIKKIRSSGWNKDQINTIANRIHVFLFILSQFDRSPNLKNGIYERSNISNHFAVSSVSMISKQTGLSRNTVKSCLDEIYKTGLLACHPISIKQDCFRTLFYRPEHDEYKEIYIRAKGFLSAKKKNRKTIDEMTDPETGEVLA